MFSHARMGLFQYTIKMTFEVLCTGHANNGCKLESESTLIDQGKLGGWNQIPSQSHSPTSGRNNSTNGQKYE
jgi:hypothetical protein